MEDAVGGEGEGGLGRVADFQEEDVGGRLVGGEDRCGDDARGRRLAVEGVQCGLPSVALVNRNWDGGSAAV